MNSFMEYFSPCSNFSSSVGCVILASGNSSRFGSNKLLTTLNDKPVFTWIPSTLLKIRSCFPVVVTKTEEIFNWCKDNQISCVLHDCPDRNDTVRLGLEFFERHKISLSSCLFANADQPLSSRKTFCGLMECFLEDPSHIWRVSYHDTPGSPVLFPSSYFESLKTLPPKKGGSYLIKKNPEQVRFYPVPDSFELFDIDTKEDLILLEKHLNSLQDSLPADPLEE